MKRDPAKQKSGTGTKRRNVKREKSNVKSPKGAEKESEGLKLERYENQAEAKNTNRQERKIRQAFNPEGWYFCRFGISSYFEPRRGDMFVAFAFPLNQNPVGPDLPTGILIDRQG